jgi:hypothetical protein
MSSASGTSDSPLAERRKHVSHRFGHLAVMCVIAAGLPGCDSPPSRIYQIDADPKQLAASLVELGDKDKDGQLSAAELKSMPYLVAMSDAYDANNDHRLSEDEIAGRLATVVFNPQKALTMAECVVLRKGTPLPGAHVRLVPVHCLAPYLPVATGTTDRGGVARLKMEPEHRPANAPNAAGLIRPGLYLIEVTHPSISIPAQYNTETTLGAEASDAAFANGPIMAQLDF